MNRFVFVVLAATACHSSCDESTGAAPVVTPEAGAPLGVERGIPSVRPVMVRPILRMPQPVASPSATASVQ